MYRLYARTRAYQYVRLCRDSHIETLREAIAGVIADPYFSIPTEEAKSCLRCARVMIQAFSQPKELHQIFSTWLVTSLRTIIQSCKSNADHLNKEKMWIKFHELTVSMEFANKWGDFTAKLGTTPIPPLLYQHITDVIFESVIKESIKSPASEPTLTTNGATPIAQELDSTASEPTLTTSGTTPIAQELDALTYEEENVVRYVGGYVIRELKKDKVNSYVLPLLEKLTDTENRTEVGDSCHWVTSINRGGLTKITDEAFQCFYDIEVHIRRFLNIKNTREMNENFSKKVINSVLSDDDLLFDWCFAASESIDQDVADKCLEKIVNKWFSIRGNSFAKNMMERYKQTSKKGTEKSKPLRSKLFTDTNEI